MSAAQVPPTMIPGTVTIRPWLRGTPSELEREARKHAHCLPRSISTRPTRGPSPAYQESVR
jgi:hypothetical protein